MNILYVEDDEHKRNSILSFIKSKFNSVHIDIASSVQGGVCLGVEQEYDLILLDMTIPNFESSEGQGEGQSFKNGGEIIVRELLDEDVNFRCAVITQYETFNNETIEQISERIAQRCGDKYLGFIKYNTLDEEWKDNLKRLLDNVKNINN